MTAYAEQRQRKGATNRSSFVKLALARDMPQVIRIARIAPGHPTFQYFCNRIAREFMAGAYKCNADREQSQKLGGLK